MKNKPQAPAGREWEDRFYKQFKDFNFHHKDLTCFHDAVLEHAVIQFISSLLESQKAEWKEEVLGKLPEIKYLYQQRQQSGNPPRKKLTKQNKGFNNCLKEVRRIVEES